MYIKDKTELRDKFTVLYRQAENLIMASPIDVDVKVHKNIRSKAQNDFYHQMCTEIADFLRKAEAKYGKFNTKYTKNLIHEINKSQFDVETTTKMTVSEFCDYMTQVIAFWQEETNYYWIPSELPISYMRDHGYTEEYTRGYIK